MLSFKNIDFNQHLDLCVQFREDSYRASFPGSDDWNKLWNPDEYANWIQQHAIRFPDGAVHIWLDDTIVGQLEFSYLGDSAHINLYYLIPQARGKGWGLVAHEYIGKTLRTHNCKTATLRASPKNLRALKFYEKTGWENLGPDTHYPEVNRFQLLL